MTAFNESYDDSQLPSIDKFKEVILSASIPSHAMKVVEKTMDNLTGLESGTKEYSNTLSYIDHLIQLPWNHKTQDKDMLSSLDSAFHDMVNTSPHVVSAIRDNIGAKFLKKTRGAKILLVDDENIALKHLSHLLRKEGYSVEACKNGEDAIASLQRVEFDIVITDLRMANVDGIQVLETTRSLYPDTHVILITGFATTETAVEAMRKGAFHYIMKPVQINELRAVIKEALSRNKAAHHEESLLCFTSGSDDRKAAVGKAIAEAAGRNYGDLSLKNIRNESDLIGRSRADGGLSPGCIIKNVCKTGASNPVIMLHDIDKFVYSLFPVLDNALTTEKNRSFVDRYLEVAFDLSDVIFVASASNTIAVASPLIDRLHVVEV